jgi:oligopeptide transport system ATP-binding protein
MELASSDELYRETLHPYSQGLLAAVPIPDPKKENDKTHEIISGDIPSPINKPKGCPFNTRCPKACDICRQEVPALREVRPEHYVACHLVK